MNIRPAELKDIERVTQLGRQLLDLHATFDKDYYTLEENFNVLFSEWVKEQITTPQRFVFVAEEENLIVGFISGFLKALYPWFRTKSVGHISYLVVDKNFQQRGIGKLLESATISWFKSKNTAYAELYVDEKNIIAHKAWSAYEFLPFKKFLRKKI